MILALVLSWLAVTRDCKGGLEPFVTYEVWTERVQVIGTAPCEWGICPVYRRTFLTASTAETSLTLADPEVGGGMFWREPVTVDDCKNRSDDPCL